MAHILLRSGYATDQSGTTFGIVSHRNATFYEPRPQKQIEIVTKRNG